MLVFRIHAKKKFVEKPCYIFLDGETGGLFEPAGLFDDAPLDNVALENPNAEPMEAVVTETITKLAEPHEEDSDDDYGVCFYIYD